MLKKMVGSESHPTCQNNTLGYTDDWLGLSKEFLSSGAFFSGKA
jgi:hypothetical protein